jgi:hypothetical protein
MPFLKSIYTPFIYLFDIISKFKINLGGLNVTCLGAQAPLQMLINLLILGIVMLFVQSDFMIFQNIALVSSCESFLQTTPKLKSFIIGLLAGLLGSLPSFVNGLLRLMQYILTLISISVFVQGHASSPACDSIGGMANIDTVLAVLTTFIFWCMVLPVIYITAFLVIPYSEIDFILKKFEWGETPVDSYRRKISKYFEEKFYLIVGAGFVFKFDIFNELFHFFTGYVFRLDLILKSVFVRILKTLQGNIVLE